MTLRLEDLDLIPKGNCDYLEESGFKPMAAKTQLGLSGPQAEPSEPYPERYKYLAVLAYQKELISEGQLAHFLRCGRVEARKIVEQCQTRLDVDADGNERNVTMPFGKSLLG
jgi:hypothetical protein